MKTKDLIKALQEADPTGELPVCVGNIDVYFCDVLPAYYDGYLEQLIIDEAKKPYFSIVGAKVIGTGKKVCLHPYSVEDGILDDPDFTVEFENVSSESEKRLIEIYDVWRKESREIEAGIKAKNKD
jgi:hypothetical protein